MTLQNAQKRRIETFRIVTIYSLFGLAWIYGSDTVLGWLVHDPDVMVKIAVLKGSLFILCTATLLYFLINRFIRQLISAESAQLESLTNYQTIFNTTNEAIFVHDAQNGHILDINDRMLEIYGYTRKEALVLEISDLSEGTPPYSQADAVENLRKALFEGPQVFEWHSRKHNGELFWSEVSLRRITIRKSDRIIAVLRDISDRKQLEESLRMREKRHQAILDSAMDGFWVVSNDGRIMEVNGAYCLMSGYSRQELLTMNIADLDVNETSDDAAAHNDRIIAQGGERFVAKHRRKDNTVYDVEVSATFIAIEGGILVGFLRDITERKRSEESLRESKATFKAFYDLGLVGLTITSPEKGWIIINDCLCNMLGYTEAELRNMTWEQLTHPDDVVADIEQFERVIDGKIDGYELEKRFLKRSGGILYTKLVVRCVRKTDRSVDFIAAMVEDITERKQAESALANSERFLKTIIDTEPECIKMLDIDCNLLMMNRAGLAMIDADSFEQVKGQCVCPLITEPYREAFTALTKSVFQGVSGILEFETIGLKQRHVWLETHAVPFCNELGEIIALLGITRDITARKVAEQEHRTMELQMQQTQKLESLGVLAGGIAHDFNNILMAIMGNADLALMRINKESPAVENLHRIEQASARAADLAKQMLAYSGKGKFVVENIDLNILLEEMLHMLEVSISKKAVLRLNLYTPLPTVEADATQMRQIIMNLVINASEAIGDKSGVIAISTGSMDCDRNYLKDVWLDENISEGLYVYLEIADTGCGMDKETLAKLFDPFFTTKFTGRGLGMAAVLGIVRGHKGAIKVYSEPKRGTTFKILLPASNRPVEIFNGASCSDDWKGEGKVLLVDDEETVRGIGAEMLKELGFSVITAADGFKAVEAFRNNPGISFIILDLTMPQMDGEQCFYELRRIKPDVRVIMSSGYNEQEVTQKFVGKGLAGFIQKPYKLSILREAIQKI